MNVLTKAVFPALRLVVWAIIAVALVKIGFFPATDDTEIDDGLTPGSDFSAPTTLVERTTIQDTINAPAVVIADPQREVTTEVTGYVGYWARSDGDVVSQGQPIVEIRKPIEGSPTGAWTRHTLEAPIAGVLTRSVPLNADVNEKDVIFTITPLTMSVEATLTPEERYRLEEDPESVEVRLNGGPEPFECTSIRTSSPVAVSPPSTPDDEMGFIDEPLPQEPGGGDSSSYTMSCPAPTDIRLVVGLTGSIVVPASEAADILVVPTTAVQSDGVTSQVFIFDSATGQEVPVQVTTGISDGTVIEIVDGLDEGDEILMFAPGSLEPLPGEEGEWEEEFYEDEFYEDGEWDEDGEFTEDDVIEESAG